MICPHCKKPIKRTIDYKVKKRIIALHKQGYSSRDISTLLLTEGHTASFSSVARIIREVQR